MTLSLALFNDCCSRELFLLTELLSLGKFIMLGDVVNVVDGSLNAFEIAGSTPVPTIL